MTGRCMAVVTIAAVLWLVPFSAAGQAPPRTAWGDPDLQGVWTGSTLTPLARPADLAGQEFLTEEQAAALEQRADRNRFVERVPSEGDPGTYNQIWFDPGTRLIPDRRTALIVDPPDGRIPYTAAMAERERLQRDYRVNGARNSWVDVDTGERCMTDGVPMFWLGYNPNHQILQTPEHVVILHEMFRDPADSSRSMDGRTVSSNGTATYGAVGRATRWSWSRRASPTGAASAGRPRGACRRPRCTSSSASPASTRTRSSTSSP